MKANNILFIVACLSVAPQTVKAQSSWYRQHHKRRGRDYALFTLSNQYLPLSVAGSSQQIAFNYSYSNVPGEYTYKSDLPIPSSNGYVQAFLFGGEFGRVNGLSGLIMGGSSHSSNNSARYFEFAIGYNWKVNDFLIIHPSIGWSTVSNEMDFPGGIENLNQDILALGKTFPYHTSYTVKGHRTDIYNNATNVGVENEKDGLVLQCEFRTSPVNRLVLGVTGGYSFYNNRMKVTLWNGSAHESFDYTDPGLQFLSSVSPNRIFTYDGFFAKVSISFCYARDPKNWKR